MRWANQPVTWFDGSRVYVSVVFSWHIREAEKLARYYRGIGREVFIDGPAMRFNGKSSGMDIDALLHHNPEATFTSRGCIRKCSFCAVPKIEGDLVELKEWEPKPVVCDNNLLACSRKHFDGVIDRLKSVRNIDFNQGLDAKLLTAYQCDRLCELDFIKIRIAWDHIGDEKWFLQAWQLLRDVGIPKRKIWVYVLFGFDDTPEDTLYRLKTIRKLDGIPYPMRYQPLDSRSKNSHVHPAWENWLLNAYTRYWAQLRYTRCIDFDKWLDFYRYQRRREQQETMAI